MANEAAIASSIFDAAEAIQGSIDRCLISPAVSDSNGEHANVVDVLDRLAARVGSVAIAITPLGDLPGQDAVGGHVASLTEAVMGLTAGLCRIAESIQSLADAVGER